MGILFHVNKILKYKVEIPSSAGRSEGKDLTLHHWCCSCRREKDTSHCAAPSWDSSAPSKEERLVPLCQVCPYSWMSRNEMTMRDTDRLQALSWSAGTPKPQHPVSAHTRVHGGHAWQGHLCSADNPPSSTGLHTACPNSAGTNFWVKGRM